MKENKTYVIAFAYYDINHGELNAFCDNFLGTEEEVIDYINEEIDKMKEEINNDYDDMEYIDDNFIFDYSYKSLILNKNNVNIDDENDLK